MHIASLLLVTAPLAPQDFIEPPVSRHAVEDRVAPEDTRPVLEIRFDGCIGVAGEWLYVPEADDLKEEPLARVRAWLAETAKGMSKDHLDKEGGTGPMVPDDALLIRPDRSTPFRYVQRAMALCGECGIWKLQLGCSTSEGHAGRMNAYLPKSLDVSAPIERIDVVIKVLEPGTRYAPAAAGEERQVATVDTGRFVYGGDRVLQVSVGTFRTKDLDALGRRLSDLSRRQASFDDGLMPVTIDARAGTVYQDVTSILDLVLDAGWVDVTFVGALD